MYFERVVAVCSYMVASLAIIYFNKWVFLVGFPYPVFVTWSQQFIGIFIYYFLAFIGKKTEVGALKQFKWELPDIYVMYKVAPQIASFSLMVSLSNLCLKYTQVSTYQVARSFCIPLGILLSKYLINSVPSKLGMFGCGLIVVGIIVGAGDPTTLSPWGLFLGGISSFFQSLNGVLVSRNMSYFNNDKQKLLLYNLWGSSIVMLPIVFLFGEGQAFTSFDNPSTDHFKTQVMALLGSALLGILINLTTFLCISLTSPVTMSVIGFGKSMIQTLGSFIFLGDILTFISGISLSFSLVGSGVYSYGQIKEMRTPKVTEAEAASPAMDIEAQQIDNVESTTNRNQIKSAQVDDASMSTKATLDELPVAAGGSDALPL